MVFNAAMVAITWDTILFFLYDESSWRMSSL